MNIHSIYGFFNRRFRPKRMLALKAMLPQIMQKETTILDLGGTARWWIEMQVPTSNITIVNIDRKIEQEVVDAGYKFVCADACQLPFVDRQFDLAISNSVIEHVGDPGRQAQFASEMRRCGKALYMQTPNYWFPIEPHLVTVGLHWLPDRLQRRCIRWLSVWGLVAKPNQERIDDFIGSTRLLTVGEVRKHFPDCEIFSERVLGLSKSFVAICR